jgi:hypothetical protein
MLVMQVYRLGRELEKVEEWELDEQHQGIRAITFKGSSLQV